MKRVHAALRALLCLFLSLELSLPAAGRAATRDLQIERMPHQSTLWVLSVGVSTYADERLSLEYADHDAQAIAQLLKSQEGLLFKEVFTHVLVNEQATRDEIIRGMSQFLGQASADDVVLIFLAGHGLQDRQTNTYYFVPYNASGTDLIVTGLPMPMFAEAVKRLEGNVNKIILLLDTCHAGAITAAARGANVGEDLSTALAESEGQYWLSASKAGEESYEDAEYRFEGTPRAHGAFTYSILRGLRGLAADDGGVVWISDLFSHVSKEVPRLTRGRQHPHGDIAGTNLPLFVVDESLHGSVDAPLPVIGPDRPFGSPAPRPARGRKWRWVLLSAAAALVAGGATVVLGGGGGPGVIPAPPDRPE